jgi:sigma-B regulation protein RsbU (phosphoserine phosphatase)
MSTVLDETYREQLRERRHQVESAEAARGPLPELDTQMKEIDGALKRLDEGSFGICEVCNEPVERDRLLADPLVHICLDHYSAEQRRILEGDLELASRIQNGLLPRTPLLANGWEVHYRYVPVGPVSGDYVDLLRQEGNGRDVFFLLGDVSGKGVAASLLMSHLQAIFRSLITLDLPLSELVARANRLFSAGTLPSSFATLVFGRAGGGGEVEFVNAGHPAPLLLSGGALTSIPTTGFPLGMFSSAAYGSVTKELGPGDLLFLYTDGLSEARNGADQEYGVPRIESFVRASGRLTGPALLHAFQEDVRAFRASAPQGDDLTVMSIQRSPLSTGN